MSSPNKKHKHLPLAAFIDKQEKRVASASVIIENQTGEALVVKAWYKPYWSLPGGVIDAGETPRDAVVREVREEVDLDISADELEFQAVIHRRSSIADTYAFVFKLKVALESQAKITIDDEEITDFDWVSKADVKSSTRGSYNRAIKNWASGTPRAYIDHATED